jgi:hypothetical protein
MGQLRDPWCERMVRVLQWVTLAKGLGGLVSFGLTPGDTTLLKRESESFELAPDGLLLRRRAEAGTNIAIMGAMDEIGGIDLEEAQATSKAVIGSLKRAPAFTRARAEVQFQLGEQAHRQDTGLLELAGRLLAD